MKIESKTWIVLTFVLSCFSLSGQVYGNAAVEALQIVNKHQDKLDSIYQLIVVFNYQPESNDAVLMGLEKRKKKWKVKFAPMHAGIGRNGFALPGNKLEGDGKSPTGLFRLGQLFSYEQQVKTKMPYLQTTSEDKWIDDPESDDYNKHVRGVTNAKSFENLILQSEAYKYCMVIEYNTNPIIKGKGSAIFFHLGVGSTAGCIAVKEDKMKAILRWLNPRHNPSMLMGNIDVLRNGW